MRFGCEQEAVVEVVEELGRLEDDAHLRRILALLHLPLRLNRLHRLLVLVRVLLKQQAQVVVALHLHSINIQYRQHTSLSHS